MLREAFLKDDIKPVRLNLRRYRGIQKIWKSYRWTRICKFSRQKCRIYKFSWQKCRIYKFSRQKCRIYKFSRQKLCFWTTWQKKQCLALIFSVQDKINQLIANLFYWYAICFIDSQPVLSIANGFNDSQRQPTGSIDSQPVLSIANQFYR